MQEKWPQENHQKTTSPGTHFGIQNHRNRTRRIPEIGSDGQKARFLKGWFFDDFLDGQKTDPRDSSHIWVTTSPGSWALWGTIGGSTKTTQYWLSDTPMGRWPGEFKIRLNFWGVQVGAIQTHQPLSRTEVGTPHFGPSKDCSCFVVSLSSTSSN